jgi:integrase
MKASAKANAAAAQGMALSKDGYTFDPANRHWKLNKDVTVAASLPDNFDVAAALGFRSTLQRYAEEMSARHTENMSVRFHKFVRESECNEVSVTALMNWRAALGPEREWHLGGLKGFLLAWHDYGFSGISNDVVELLLGWRITGNEKGAAVASGDAETGPFTDLELQSLLDWANVAVVQNTIAFEDYAYLLTLAMTARRSIQIAALRGKDLALPKAGDSFYTLNVPRSKQRGGSFRGEFRSLPIPNDLGVVLQQQHTDSVKLVESRVGYTLNASLRDEIPIFINASKAYTLRRNTDGFALKELLLGSTPDLLHATTTSFSQALQRVARACTARSERTGEYLRLTATRFRYTRGTKLRREGFGAYVIAELLDQSDIQQVKVYTENTAQEAVFIDRIVGPALAPFAQACLGTLVRSERDAIRGDDPTSRVSNDRQNAVGTCGNFGFCASGYRACYTCVHFQPWLDAPHSEVLEDLYAEKLRVKEAGCAEVVVNANDLLILAVEDCVSKCAAMRQQLAGASCLAEVADG